MNSGRCSTNIGKILVREEIFGGKKLLVGTRHLTKNTFWLENIFDGRKLYFWVKNIFMKKEIFG